MGKLAACVLALAGAACGRVSFDPRSDSAASDTTATRRNEIIVRGSLLAETVEEFPLFVPLRAPQVDLASIAADGADLRFYAADGVTALPYEIEQVSGTGFDVWVRVPQITRGVDETLWLRYGDPDAPAGEQREAVWADDFIAVWHLADGRDATANGLDGTFNGTTSAAGIAGAGRDLGFGYMEVPNAPALAAIGATGAATWSAWARPVILPDSTSALIDRQRDASAEDDFRFGPTASADLNGQISLDPGTMNVPYGGGSFVFGEWCLFTMVWDGTTLRAGVNGIEQEVVPATGTLHASPNPVWLGAGCNVCDGRPVSDLMDGMLDEARILSVVRSPGWFRAEYLNLTSPLVVVQPVETL